MPTATLTATADCPECYAGVKLENVVENEVLQCAECGVDLEVVALDPPTLALAPTEEEDWGE